MTWDFKPVVAALRKLHPTYESKDGQYPTHLLYSKKFDLYITAMSKEQAEGHKETYFAETGERLEVRAVALRKPDKKQVEDAAA